MRLRSKKVVSYAVLLAMLFTVLSTAGIELSSGPVALAAVKAASSKLEAEKSTYSGGAIKASKNKGYSGTGYVQFPVGKTGASITFKVTVPQDCIKNVTLEYANGNKARKSLNIYLNGKKVKTSSLASTSGWTRWNIKNETLNLKAGSNTITYKNISKDAIVFDCISISDVFINEAVEYQKITGLGGFGGNSAGTPFTDDNFVDTLVNDLGVSIVRMELQYDLEPENDNNDPNKIDLSKFNINGDTKKWIDHFKALKAKGVKNFIASIWSPPAWMKTNGKIIEGGNLKDDCYEEFAEYCTAFIKIMKNEAGIDMYGLSIQNEPAFEEPYQSCVYSPEQYARAMDAVGKRFKKEGIKTLLFGPEHMLGNFESMRDYIWAMEDTDTLKYLGAIAVHGYGSNGVDANSPAPTLWDRAYETLAKKYKKQLWMTETSGYTNSWKDTMNLAQDIYVALKFGKINAWVWWRLSDCFTGEFAGRVRNEVESLMKDRVPTPKYYVSKNYYRYIRPGAMQIDSNSSDKDVLVVAFNDKASKKITIVLINKGGTEKTIDIGINGTGLPREYKAYRTSATENCIDAGTVKAGGVKLPASSITTLYGSY